jgi:hypothetical protein
MRARCLAALIGATVTMAACSPPPVPRPDEDPPAVLLGSTTQVLPGPGIPSDAPLLQSNNNLDVIESQGSRFLAIRTSLVHFATPFTKLVVFRSDDDGGTWDTEAVVERGRDMREPRLLDLNGRIFLYFFEAGTNPLAFEPGRVFAMQRRDDATWTAPVPISPENTVVWRTKVLNGVPYMVRYREGSDSYAGDGDAAIEVDLLTTANGYDWVPVNPARPVVHTGGGSEADFAFDGDGRLWSVMRNDAGERGQFGSLVCTAPSVDITDWDCLHDPRKFDSPLVFSHGGEIWMLARRQVANDGRYDLGAVLPPAAAFLVNQAAYWVTPKRLALWRIDRAARRVDWVVDLPSRGDTAFPGIVWTGPDSLLVYNYSSPIDGPDLAWVQGQLGPTNIYVTPLMLPH